jgi:hypothetical protein
VRARQSKVRRLQIAEVLRQPETRQAPVPGARGRHRRHRRDPGEAEIHRHLLTSHPGRRLGLLLVAATALLALAPAAAAKAGSKPDLLVTAAKLSGDPFVFYGGAHQPNVSFSAVTANHGSSGAGPSVTTVYLEHGGKRWRLATRAVPALGPGAKDRGRAVLVREPRLPLGGYTVAICADGRKQVAETREQNNCKQLPDHFFVVATDWDGSIDGKASLGPLLNSGPIPGDHSLESWSSDDVDYFFDEYKGEGVFDYELVGTHFEYHDSGADAAGCTYSGGGTSKGDGSFVVDYLNETYNGLAGVATFYSIVSTCPRGEAIDLEGPATNIALQTSIIRPSHEIPQRAPFGSFKLAGSSSEQELGSTWNWSLEAKKP